MANNTTTQHIEALIADDGHQFAMVRKADLKALLFICNANPHQGRYLDTLGEANRTMAEMSQVIDESFSTISKMSLHALKHGVERKRYMANNRALLSRIAELESQRHRMECSPGAYLVYFPAQYGVKGRYVACNLSHHGSWSIARTGAEIPAPRVAAVDGYTIPQLVCGPAGTES